MNESGRDAPGADVLSAISGDRDALRRLWQEHRRWVAAILMAYKPREAEVEDLLQSVAVQVVRKIGTVREPEAFRPWLRRIAINAARAEGRKVTRRGSPLSISSEAPAAETGCAAERWDEAGRLMELARELPEGYREPLLMRCARGMSYTQISAVLDLPETTVETRIARGRRMLRDLVAGEANAGSGRAPAKRSGHRTMVI